MTGPDPQFRNWLSQTVGIDLPNIDNPETFASLMIINGGKGFSGILKAVEGFVHERNSGQVARLVHYF